MRENKTRTQTKKVKRVIDGYIDYKDQKQLQRFLTDQGKIIPRRITGLTAKQHRELVQAIKRARHLAILPFVSEAVK
ncbi:MAG: 30S ribosomal protein S18 [Bacteroidetes bacterium]|nr:30S ribosomal protein S18 [Bacteroidota bacterium]